jgi:hypothetical protein
VIGNAARHTDLDNWINRDLTPYITEQLTTHPRFKGELVRFVVFNQGNPAPTADELAISLRDQLADAVIDVPGIRVGWSHAAASKPRRASIDCSKDAVHYYIGLEISETDNGRHRIDLRALDLEDRSWVTGFARSWQGKLSKSERRALARAASDQSFRGQRSVPYSNDQPDLLAAHLAHDLGCALLRQVAGEYQVALEDTEAIPMDGLVELVSNNLSAYRALQITADTDQANATLSGKAHHVDGDLYQYWITITPTDSASDLKPLGASAYVHLPGIRAGYRNGRDTYASDSADRYASPGPTPIRQSDANVLSSIRIVELRGARVCSTGNVSIQKQITRGSRLQDWLDDCFALQVKTNEDAVVFFLNHQLNHGLVRLSGRDCGPRTEARIARANEPLQYALPLLSLTHGASSPAGAWQTNPDADVYYAIAVSDSRAARALSRQLELLPRRCSISVHPGLEGIHLENWMAEFSATVDQWQAHVDWQAIRVRNVF